MIVPVHTLGDFIRARHFCFEHGWGPFIFSTVTQESALWDHEHRDCARELPYPEKRARVQAAGGQEAAEQAAREELAMVAARESEGGPTEEGTSGGVPKRADPEEEIIVVRVIVLRGKRRAVQDILHRSYLHPSRGEQPAGYEVPPGGGSAVERRVSTYSQQEVSRTELKGPRP